MRRWQKPCWVLGSSESGANQIKSGSSTHRICPAMTRREFGFSSVSGAGKALPSADITRLHVPGSGNWRNAEAALPKLKKHYRQLWNKQYPAKAHCRIENGGWLIA